MPNGVSRKAAGMGKKKSQAQFWRFCEKEGWVCWLCKRPIDPELFGRMNVNGGPSIDHVIPLSNGGKGVPNNRRLAHRKCNAHRHEKFPETIK